MLEEPRLVGGFLVLALPREVAGLEAGTVALPGLAGRRLSVGDRRRCRGKGPGMTRAGMIGSRLALVTEHVTAAAVTATKPLR